MSDQVKERRKPGPKPSGPYVLPNAERQRDFRERTKRRIRFMIEALTCIRDEAATIEEARQMLAQGQAEKGLEALRLLLHSDAGGVTRHGPMRFGTAEGGEVGHSDLPACVRRLDPRRHGSPHRSAACRWLCH